MTNKLHPPTDASPDGREIWDWADRLSKVVRLCRRARELEQHIYNAESTCGSCQSWMTDTCPREVLDKRGHKRGPSMKEPKCRLFVISRSSGAQLEATRAKLAAVLAELEATK